MICVCVYETHISISTALRCLLAILYSPKDKNLNEKKKEEKNTQIYNEIKNSHAYICKTWIFDLFKMIVKCP